MNKNQITKGFYYFRFFKWVDYILVEITEIKDGLGIKFLDGINNNMIPVSIENLPEDVIFERPTIEDGICKECGELNVLTTEGICLWCYDKKHPSLEYPVEIN